ncbi:hypothetical protein OEZ86_000937 [Tetradesmus obliquus]|nr:hypothetical protein OEZ86_000937 [Tetradesmus obliquus]
MVLAEALTNLKHLRSLDLSHCPNLTNKSLYQLAKYAAEPQQDEQDDAEQAAAGSDDEFDYEQYARANGYSGDEDGSSSSSGEWEQWPEEEEGAAAADADAELAEHAAAGSQGKGGASGFADDGLRQVLQGPATKHSLAVLDISGCRRFSSAGLVVPPLGVLRELRASRVQGLTQLVLHLPASHPMERLDLSCCHFLRLVDVALPQLVGLNLSACRTLYRLRMRCPSLTSLSLAQCGSLIDLHPDAWQVPALQQLNLFGCRRASGLQLQAVLAGLPQLRAIDLNGCWNMHSLHFTAQLQLESVDITGCRNLGAFSSSSPCLLELCASACSRLHSLTLASRCMLLLQLANCSQLSEVYVAAAAPPPPPPRIAAAVDGRGQQSGITARGSGKTHSSSSSSGRKLEGSGSGASSGRGLVVSGCTSLSPEARARLAAAVAV